MTDISKLLHKYEKQYVNGEKRTPDYDKRIREETALKKRKQIAKYLKYEAKHLTINEKDLDQVNYLIEFFNDKFNQLYKSAKEETIILAFIFFVLQKNKSLKLSDYRITGKYDLTDKKYNLIITRMLHFFLEKKPLTPVTTTSYDHEILYETHGKIEQ